MFTGTEKLQYFPRLLFSYYPSLTAIFFFNFSWLKVIRSRQEIRKFKWRKIRSLPILSQLSTKQCGTVYVYCDGKTSMFSRLLFTVVTPATDRPEPHNFLYFSNLKVGRSLSRKKSIRKSMFLSASTCTCTSCSY